jgi:hypothetical protein
MAAAAMSEWHNCHFCGTLVRDGYESDGTRHWLSDCRPDLTEHEPGPTCTWWGLGGRECYADHAHGTNFVYEDGPT